MKNTMNSAAKTVFFALFAFFLFNGQLSAADSFNPSTQGCHMDTHGGGCDTAADARYNQSAYSDPTYAPSWTEVTTLGRVRGGQYLVFYVNEGDVYSWSTEGKEDVFYGEYSKPCTSDSQCRTASDTSDKGLRCLGKTTDGFHGYCLLPFDTELTLIKGQTCAKDATLEFLAYSNSDGFRNQSQLEWKATFSGTVTLLVTNYEYQQGTDSQFLPCQKTASDSNYKTTVKWRRTSSEHCATCGLSADYKQEGGSADDVAKAPNWTTVEEYAATSPIGFDTTLLENWIKPGSYLTFEVKENEIYRWSTCKSEIHDTQLTLFKGEPNNTDSDHTSCGEFLAYNDDSKVSYIDNNRTYCPEGTKATVLEWQANFTGMVTLLFSEYNCYQCSPIKNPINNQNNWLSCYDAVEGTYKATVDANNNKTVVITDGFPEIADPSCNPQVATSPCVKASFIYTYPLHWQRYDCRPNGGGTQAAKIADYTTESGWSPFSTGDTPGGSQALSGNNYVTFSLRRGSKYLFETTSQSAIITIKKNGETVAQGTWKLTYFADSVYDGSSFPADVIDVYVSGSDCNSAATTLKYNYYGDKETASVTDRFKVQNFEGSYSIVTDLTTGMDFSDTGKWATTWQEAIKTCQAHTVGGGDGADVLRCPDPDCPTSALGTYTEFQPTANPYFCKYHSSAADADGNCLAPTCSAGYKELEKRVTTINNTPVILNPEEEDFWGKCYYSGSDCDATEHITSGSGSTPDQNCYARPVQGCNEGSVYVAAKWGCCYCKPDYDLKNDKCYKYTEQCLDNQKCITKGGSCDTEELDVTEAVCPEGSTEHDGKCVTDTSTSFPVYYNPGVDTLEPKLNCHLDDDTYGDCLQIGGEGESCPEGTTDVGGGICEYDGCGQYAYYNDFQNLSGRFVLKQLLDEDPKGCYASASANGEKVPCCCSKTITKFYKTGSTQAQYAPGELEYATSLNPGGTTVATTDKWTCPEVTPCPDGYTLGNDNTCYKCAEGLNLLVDADGGHYRCYSGSCRPNQTAIGNKCYQCPTGYTLIEENGDYTCKKECPSNAYLDESTNTCYTNIVDKVRQCNMENGWVQDPDHEDRCRIVQKTNGVYKNVKCENNNAQLENNISGRTCDTGNPNSYDCHCFYDRCEQGTTEADAKVCPQYKIERYRCGGTSLHPKYCERKYPITPHQSPVDLNGDTVLVDTLCEYQDATGQTCGEPMGGWTLPNINQLYSIVDFDLYDPATAYPFKGVSYNRDTDGIEGTHCEKVESSGAACTTTDDCVDGNQCAAGHCISADPYGDLQCDAGGRYLCIDNKCVRNNWYWSSTTVVSENNANGQFIWAVNMEDGRSYRAKKGCVGDECAVNVDLSARPHHVLCIKGASISGIFDSDAPVLSQTFSGWACDTTETDQQLTIYFEITDSDNGKDVVSMMRDKGVVAADSPLVGDIPGVLRKGIKYGATDIIPPADSQKSNEIYANCGFKTDPKPHVFEVVWKAGETGDIAEIIQKIQQVECSQTLIDNTYNNLGGDTSNCALPPYFVTAYAVNEAASSVSAVEIAPTRRPFVFQNYCGDNYKTYDGTYTEDCESEDFSRRCGYQNDDCTLCDRETCMLYPGNPPKCHDGILQSYYCVNTEGATVGENEFGKIAEGHTGAGLDCQYFDFAAGNIVSSSEECECSGDAMYYYYTDPDSFDCSRPLSQAVCPDYNSAVNYSTFNANDENNYCYICNTCKKTRQVRPYCGDHTIQRSNCSGYTNCVVVQGANEECDDQNNSDTDSCTNDCKQAKCGDGFIQASLGEICDSGTNNGHYETHCASDDTKCPGCASSTCGIDDPENALGPRCGDGKIQHVDLCDANTATLVANGYANQQDFYNQNGFDNKTDCQTKLAGALEKCDLGKDEDGNSKNGRAVSFEDFLACLDDTSCNNYGLTRTDCSQGINDVVYPVNAIHAKFLECVYKYKQFIHDHPGCSADCKTATAPYCGDTSSTKTTLDPGEICDDGLPLVSEVDGAYVLSGNGDKYNGRAYYSCRLDCKGKYECNNSLTETSNCLDKINGKCPNVGEGNKLYVANGPEICDEGKLLNGNYSHCDANCTGKAYCGNKYIAVNAEQECIIKNPDGTCKKYEECDFGTEGNIRNKSIELAYSTEFQGSCVVEDADICKGDYDNWEDTLCCVFGRYCGDGTVDNGVGVDKKSDEWRDASKWSVKAGGADIEYDSRNMAMRFKLTDTNAVVELNAPIEINLDYRYFMEFDLVLMPVDDEELAFDAGTNEYDANDNLIVNGAAINASPYYFVDIANPSTEYISHFWYHGKNISPIKGEAEGGNWNWYTGTKSVRLIFKMEGDTGTEFLVRSLSFYNLEDVSYKSTVANEMCDPGENAKDASNSYMTDCNASCKWINYCGDGVVQRYSGCGTDGKFNGYDCVDGISGAEEICDDGSNVTNTYGGCEPGCLELGPRCGDGILDCPDENSTTCHYAKGAVRELCDNGETGDNKNSNTALTGKQSSGALSNYGTCRTDCRPSRCGDGIWDKDAYVEELVPVTDEAGEIIYEVDAEGHQILDPYGNPIPVMQSVSRKLEECDCGAADAYFEGVTSEYQVDLNAGKEGQAPDMFYICKNDKGGKVYNTNSEKRKAVCRPNCTISRCGDGILDTEAGEECDDGNDNDHDSCTNSCKENTCNDKIFAYTRSYLCEELIGMTTLKLQDMAKKGVVDCDGYGSSTYTCAALAGVMTSASAVADKFDEGILHCCYNRKLRGGVDADDKNCEFDHIVNGQTKKLSPKAMAVQRCKDNGYAESGVSGFMDAAGDFHDCDDAEIIERCDLCQDADCGCSAQYPVRTEQAQIDGYKKCLENNKYCITDASSPKKCWNILGACGDGKINPGEQCDNMTKGVGNTFDDLDDTPQTGDNKGIGGYCTGDCRGTSCTTLSPICTSDSQNNCWEKGCTHKLHKKADDTECPEGLECWSQCGDNRVDAYAVKTGTNGQLISLEECDYGTANVDDWAKGYCSTDCKKNKNSSGDAAECGDGEIQENNEECDDGNKEDGDYCVDNCQTYYGTCGDGEIHGPGFNLYDSLNKLTAPNESNGPEYCDFKDKGGGSYDGDARSVSLAMAGVTGFCDNNCGTTGTALYTCGDKNRNPRFEGCDFGGNNKNATIECTNAIKVASNGTVDDFGLCTEKTIGRKCYEGCQSDAIGGLIRASSLEIYGWACDPDHPMTHVNNFVTLKFFNKNGQELAGSPVTVKTDKNFGYTSTELTNGTDVNGYTINQNFTVEACGGGSSHGWFFNPSTATTVTFVNGPYTVKAYAKSLDSGELAGGSTGTDVSNMVFLGQATFVMSMVCGDKEVSKCSDITVRIKHTDEQGNATYQDVPWEPGRTCSDSELYGGKKCEDYGLSTTKPCVNETCDNGTGYNGNDKDCSAACQWTYCGDGTKQDKAGGTQPSGYVFRPEANRATPNDPEECDNDPQTTCKALLSDKIPASGNTISTDRRSCTTGCKWNVSGCKVESACPGLDTAEMMSKTEFKKPASTYIKYKGTDSTVVPQYTRTWSGDYSTGSFPAAQTIVKHISQYGANDDKTCAFECVDDLVWDPSQQKCVGTSGRTADCSPCQDDNAVWLGTTTKCTGGTMPTVTYRTEVNSSTGDIDRFDADGNKFAANEPLTKYGTAADTKNCIYQCNSTSTYANGECNANTKPYECKYGDSTTFNEADTRRWVKVWKDENGQIQMSRIDEANQKLVITQHLSSNCGQQGGTCTYLPATGDLTAYDINNSSQGVVSQSDNLGTSASDIRRCFYTCKQDYELQDDGSCKHITQGDSLCGNGIIDSEHCDIIRGTDMAGSKKCRLMVGAHELCDDQTENGTYGKTTGGLSFCKSDCGVSDAVNTNADGTVVVNADGSVSIKNDGYIKCVADHNGVVEDCDNKYGRIKGGAEYFCGDGVTQYKGSCTGVNCKEVNSTNYPGAKIDAFSASSSEECDGDSDRKKLCNRWLTKNSKPTAGSYYNIGSISCTDKCKISGGSTDNCAFCGDKAFQPSNESCDLDYSGNIITAAGTYGKTCNNKSWTTSQSTSWTVPATGQYKITVYGAQGGDGNGETGGKGAKVWGTFDLTYGDTLYITVGAKGTSKTAEYTGGNGGGGSAVKKGGTQNGKDGTLLLVAGGGGGGGGGNVSGGQASNDGSSSGGLNPNVTAPTTTSDGAIGDGDSTGGKGWVSGFNFSGGTGVKRTKVTTHACSSDTYEYFAHGGGGGGYSGGSGAWSNNKGGGGGGSYKSGTDSDWTAAEHAGAGKVEITQIKYKNCNSSCTGFSDADCQ